MKINKNAKKFVKSSVSVALVASTIGAVVPEQTVSASSFTDLSPSNTHFENIAQLLERGVINGFPDGSYRPNEEVTRGQAAKIIASLLNLDTKNVKNPGFVDISENHQYYGYISALVQAGIINGYSDQTFKQHNVVTRGQMAKMLARAFQLKATTFENPFTDLSPSHEYYSYITALYEAQVTQGKAANEFDMKSAVTRGQLASFVIRAEKATSNNSTIEGTIDNISKNTISISGSTYKIDEQFQFLVNIENKNALLNANITITHKAGVVTVIDRLALASNSTTFNGYGAEVKELIVPSTFNTLENLTSDTIHYATTTKKVTLNSVTAENVTIQVKEGKTVSLTSVSNLNTLFELIVNNSTFTNLTVHANNLVISENNSAIQNVFANLARTLTLNGQFDQIHTNGDINLLGTAQIHTIHWQSNPNNASVASTLAIQNTSFNSAIYSWTDALKQFSISIGNSGSGNDTNPNSDNDSDSDSGSNTGDNSVSNGGANTGDNSVSNGGANTGDNPVSNGGSNTGDNSDNDSTSPDTANVLFEVNNIAINSTLDTLTGQVILTNTTTDSSIITTSSDSSTIVAASIKVLKADNEVGQTSVYTDGTFTVRLQNVHPQDTLILEVTVNGQTKRIKWTVPAQQPTQTSPQQINNASVRVENGQLLISTATGESEQYTVTNTALQQLLLDNQNIIENVSFDAENNEITALRRLSLATNNFDGSALAALPQQIESLHVTANNDSTLANITNVAQLTVEGNGSVTLQGTVTGTTTIEGNVNTINGGTSDILIINSTAAQITVTNNRAHETIVPDSTKIIQQARIASLTDDFRAVAATTSMSITFVGDATNAGQSLTIERSDVKVNLEGEHFSRISIKNNGVNITAESSNAHLFVSNNVSQLTLDADVSAFTLNLEQPIVISSSSAKKIDTLTINTTKSSPETDGWIELINITVGTSNILLTDKIFKQSSANSNTEFSSTANYEKFGYYSLNFTKTSGANYYYKFLKGNESVNSYKNLPTSEIIVFTEYTDAIASSGIYIPADVTEIMLYEVNGNTVKVSAPAIQQDQYLLYYLTSDNSITAVTRFGDSQSPADTLGPIHIFKNGSLATSLATGSSWEKNATVGNEFNTVTFNLGFNLNGTREIFVTKSSTGAFGSSLTTHENDYVNALKKLAQIAVETNDTTHFETLLEVVAANKGITYNSFFLSKYVQQINDNPSQITKLTDYQTVFNNVNNQNAYDRGATLTAAQLYLTGTISNAFTYSIGGIVKNTISDDGKLTFTGDNAGSTTLRVADSNGSATLVNVTVDADKNVTTTILKTELSSDTLIEGTDKFRSVTVGNQAYLLPTELKTAVAIIQKGTSATDKIGTLSRIILSSLGSTYALSAEEEITAKKISFSELGLDSLSILASTYANGWVEGTDLILYPRFNGKESILIGNATKSTAVYINTTTKVDFEIAKSAEKYSIENGLHLKAFVIEKDAGTANVHIYNNNGEIELFANNAAQGHYIFTDNANDNNKTIVNFKASNTNDKVTVDTFAILKENLIGNDTNATITTVSGNSVRYVGNTIFAVRKGVSTVTLSDGTQFEVAVEQSGETYTLKAEKVANYELKAANLHMTDISTVDTADDTVQTQLINNKQSLLLRLSGDKTTTFTLTSSIGEKAIVHITKTGDTYSTAIDRSQIDKADLELNTITDVIGLPMDIIAARAAFDTDNVYIYNLNKGTRSFRVTNGTISTAINVTVDKNSAGQFESTPTAITHDITDTINGNVTSNAARLVGNKLYATGLSMTNGEATIEVPLAGGAKYNIKLTQDADTGLYSFADNATIAYSYTVNKADLGLDTITSATAPNTNMVAQVDGDNVIVTLNADTNGRVRINGTKGNNTTAASYVYFVRDDVNGVPKQTIEKQSLADKLSDYGLNSNSSVLATRPDIARLATKADLSVEVFALDAGTTGYEVRDSTGKAALFNISVNDGATATDSRTVDAQIVRHEFTTDNSIPATIIEGDAVRIHDNFAYAVKGDASAKVRLSTGKVIHYTVEVDSNGQFVLTPAEQANAKTIQAANIGLSGHISATGFDPSIVSITAYNDTISIFDATTTTDATEKKTGIVVTDASSNKSLVNVTIAANKEITVSEAIKTTATAPKLIHSVDGNIVRIVGDEIYAITEGTATLLVGNEIQQVTVSKANGHYAISTPTTVSSTILTAADLGLDANTNMTIETGYDSSVAYVGLFKETSFKDKVIAYSLLNSTTGATEFVVKASDTGLRTLVRVTAGTTFTHKIAEQAHTFASAPAIADTTTARYANDKLYALKEGHTYATVNNRLQAIYVTRVDNHLTAAVTELKETITGATFTALTENETNTAIIDIAGDTIYAKTLGQTKVKNDDQVYIVNVTNTNGLVEMNVTPITSKTVSVTDMGLGKLTAASIVQTTDAISLSRAEDSLTIFSKGTPTAQMLTVKVTDENNDHAIVNVTINEQGEVSTATVAKEIFTMSNSATGKQQTTKARAVWNGTTFTVYALEAGKTKFAFDDALVNINTTANGNLINTIAITPLAHNLTGINEITNGAIINEHYVTNAGTAIVHANGKVYSVTAEDLTDEYKLTVSNGVPFTTLEVTNSTYVTSGSGTIAVKDEDETSTLIIYQDGVGTTDIAVTSGGKTIVHQVKSDTNGLTPKVAKKELLGVAIPLTAATLLDDTTENTSLRLENDTLYYLADGISTFKLTNGRLATVNVTRGADQFFTSTESFVSATLKEVPLAFSSTNFELDGSTVFALNGETTAAEVFYSTEYRTSLQTVVENGGHKVKLDERKMKSFNFADYGLSGTVTVTEGGNTKPTVAKAETHTDQIIIYAGDVADTTNITLTDGTTTVTFIATVDEQGEIVVTPQATLNSVLFADLELTTTTPITANNLNNAIMSVAVTDTGLNIIANGTGQGSIELKQNGATVAIVNVSITQNANKQYNVTATPLTFETVGSSLLSTATARQSTATPEKYYVTSSGYFFYESATDEAFYAKVTLGTDKVYTFTDSTHTLKKVTATNLDLDTITSASVSGSIATVDKLINSTTNVLYIFGLNDGQVDVTVKGTKDGKATSAIIVTENGTILETAIAKETLAGTWTKVAGYNEIATVRNGQIYAIASGKSVYEDKTSAVKKLANITITRNANMHYNIISELVTREYTGKTVTVIDGSSVQVDGSTVYAQQEGLSTIKVDNDYFTVTVLKNADGLFKLEISAEAIVQATFTPADLGVDAITNTTISSITGAGVVTSLIKDGNVIIYAKNTGQADIRINDDATTTADETKTIIHALVTETNGKLVLTPTIAKEALTGAETVQSQGLFRGVNDELFALGEGQEVAAVNGELYNLTATKVKNALKLAAARIELSFDSAVSNPTDLTVIKVDSTTVIALKAGTSDVTVDGQTYRITVGSDGSIKKDLIQSDTVNVSEALSAITNVTSTLTDATFNGTVITLTPKANAAGTEIMTVKNGTDTIQVRVTVKNENGQTSVQSEIVKQTFNTASFGFSPLTAELTDGTAFKATNGVVKVDNLIVTVYPGAPGTSFLVITGNESQQAIYRLAVDNAGATFTPFTQTVSYNDIQFLPNVLASTGTAKAIGNDAGGFNVQFKDLNESIFVVQGDNASYKTITVKAKHTNNIVAAEAATVKDAHVVTGTVTATSDNLKTVEHNGNTIIYTDKNTPATGFYTVNGVTYNVAIAADYTITATRVERDAASYTAATHLFGDGVVAIVNEGTANKWVVKATGKGIYKVGTDYVEVTVTKAADQTFTITVGDTFAKGSLNDATLTNVTVIEPASGVYADNGTIFGTATSTVVVKAIKDGKPILYTGTVTDKTMTFTPHEASIKDTLGWTGYKLHDLNAASTVARIDGDTLYATGVGTEQITFTSENGVSQTVIITVANDYTVTVTPTNKNVITYTTSNDNGWDLVTYTLTFDLSINEDLDIELDAATVGTVFIDETINKITITQPAGTQKVYGFTISLPELNNTALPFEIVLNNAADYYIQTTTGSTLEFKKTI